VLSIEGIKTMPLNKNIKQQVIRITENGRSDIHLSEQAFLNGDVEELVVLLNQSPTITSVDLSRNTLDTQDICALAQLKYVKKLILIMSDVAYADASILCVNENFQELVLDSRDLDKDSLDQLRKIQRANPLTILVTKGIDIKEFKGQDVTIKLGPQTELMATSSAEAADNVQTDDEQNRKKNHSDESTASRETAPVSASSRNSSTERNNILSCCPLSFGWGSAQASSASKPSDSNISSAECPKT